MTADIIQFRPKPNPNREKELERQAIEIMNVALMGEPGMVGMEPVIMIDMGTGVYIWPDTAPSEMNPYTAPDKDSA
jgi:hypothetical protein